MQALPTTTDTTTIPRSLVNVASRFERASAEMLHSHALLRRTDTKFLLSSDTVIWLLAGVTNDYCVLPSHDKYFGRYRTIYFDTPDLLCFNEHQRGRRPRHKVRIRHYLDRRRTFFEIKTSLPGEVTDKVRDERVFGDESFRSSDQAAVSRYTDLPARELRPSLVIDYSRATFFSLHSAERVTVDLKLVFDGSGPGRNLDNLAILEVKQPSLDRQSPFMRLLHARGVRPSSASKYCTALALSRPHLRVNRFRPALRTLRGICP